MSATFLPPQWCGFCGSKGLSRGGSFLSLWLRFPQRGMHLISKPANNGASGLPWCLVLVLTSPAHQAACPPGPTQALGAALCGHLLQTFPQGGGAHPHCCQSIKVLYKIEDSESVTSLCQTHHGKFLSFTCPSGSCHLSGVFGLAHCPMGPSLKGGVPSWEATPPPPGGPPCWDSQNYISSPEIDQFTL